MKRHITFLLAALLIFILTACGTNSASSGSNEPKPVQQTTPAPAETAPEAPVQQTAEPGPAPESQSVRVFGPGAQNPGQMAVMDTDLDVYYAVIGCVLCGAALLAKLVLLQRARQKRGAPGRTMAKAYSCNE